MILSKNNCVNTWATTMSKNTYHYKKKKKKHDIMDFGKQSKRIINMGPKNRNK
jgi:hypothetical protein